jgi:hypothetical protein
LEDFTPMDVVPEGSLKEVHDFKEFMMSVM